MENNQRHYEQNTEELLQELSKEKEFTDSLLDNLTIGFAAIDKKNTMIMVNKELLKMTGFKREELLGQKPPFKYWTEENLENIKEVFQKALRGHEGSFELIFKKKNGQRFPALVSPRIVKDPTGANFYIVTIKNITKLKETEEELRISEQRLKTIFNKTPTGYALFDIEGRFIFLNENYAKILGYTPKKLLKKRFADLTHPDDKEANLTLFRKMLSGKLSTVTFEKRYIKKDGNVVWVILNTTLLRDSKNKPDYFITQIQDITERKKAEGKLKKREMTIRRAYVDIFYSVTGGKLVLVTKDELKRSLGKPIGKTITAKTYKDLASARKKLKEIICKYFTSLKDTDAIILATDEALTNSIKHASGGRIRVYKNENKLEVLISDDGPGIDFTSLPKATLLKGYSTKKTLGVGFDILLDASDRTLLFTDKTGTDVVIEATAKAKSN